MVAGACGGANRARAVNNKEEKRHGGLVFDTVPTPLIFGIIPATTVQWRKSAGRLLKFRDSSYPEATRAASNLEDGVEVPLLYGYRGAG